MRSFLLISLLALLTACGSDKESATAPEPSTAPAFAPERKATPAPEAAPVPLSLEEQIAVIKSEYALISQEMEGEVYTADTIRYSCEEGMTDGEVLLYSDSEALRLVVNSLSLGDHAGMIEYWYFKEGEPFFVLEEIGSWQFGGPYREDEDGNQIMGSIDRIEQTRYYIAEGKVVRELNKAFEIKSWEDSPTADQVPNKEVPTAGDLPEGYESIKAAINTGKMDCDLIAI